MLLQRRSQWAPQKKGRLTHSEVQKLSRSEEFREQEDSGHGQSPLHFLTGFLRIDTVQLGKELVGENRGIDRILRGLKLHAEGRQFGDQNS